MYQPQIRDELIRRLYRVSHAYEMPMTKMLNHILSTALNALEGKGDEYTIVIPSRPPEPDASEDKTRSSAPLDNGSLTPSPAP